ncbi:MAG: DUF4136 domain-containing protein [Deltaproteobacteria bacterium]|nr:DUF4136 domain-containing protein [Deltaproteobacteria bacterium]
MSHLFRVLVPTLLLALGCAALPVETDYDPAFDFGGYKQFGWLTEKQPLTGDVRLDNPLLHERLREAIGQTLTAAGFEAVPSDDLASADFRVGYHLALQRRLDVTTLDSHYGYGPGANRWGHGPPETIVREYDEGTLVIDVVDSKSDRLVWRGSAYGRMSETATPEQRQERAHGVVATILELFPPSAE